MRSVLRWIFRLVLALVVALGLFLGLIYWRSETLLAQHFDIQEPPLAIPADADAIARGGHWVATHACQDCHGADLGGKVMVDALPVGRFVAVNLTRGKGGLPATYSATDWERALRHGIGADGRLLRIMPSAALATTTDADLVDMIAYLNQVPPVDRELPPMRVGPIPRTLTALGKMTLADARVIDHHASHVATHAVAPTADYGQYLAAICAGCHGAHFSGGRIPGEPPQFPPAANITPDPATGLGKWTKADFYTAMRTGQRPNGTTISRFMPWESFKNMSDVELDALWAYLQTLPARPVGQR